jgi:hypothetical protein
MNSIEKPLISSSVMVILVHKKHAYVKTIILRISTFFFLIHVAIFFNREFYHTHLESLSW